MDVFHDVQVQAVEASGYMRNPSGVAHQRTLVPAVRRLNTLFRDEVLDGKRGVVEEVFLQFLDELWMAVARVLVAPKISDVVLLAVSSLTGEFLHRKSSKSKEVKGKEELRVELLKKLMEATQAEDRTVRLRTCHLLQIVVNRLGFIEEELETQLRKTMLLRLNDKLTSVRIQSIYGLKNLQEDPVEDEKDEDEVTRELRKLMVSDPSKDVRKAALLNLTMSRKTYQDLLIRIRDVSEDVRHAAFRTIGNEIPMEDVPINDRAHLLDQGLQDRAVRVRKACEQMVLKKWFPECDSSPVLLLQALDIEQYPEIGSKVSRLLLKHFSEQPRALLEKEGVVEFNALDMMSENSEAFNAASVFFWREQCYYYQKVDHDLDKAAAILPNVSDFSKMLVATCRAESDVLFIAQQLLKFGHLLDFQDEFGRRNLLDALQNLLRELGTDSQLIKGIMELMAFVYSGSSEQEFIQVVAEIVSDMYDPVEAGNQEVSASQQEDVEIAPSQPDDDQPALSFGPHFHTLSEEDREAAEAKFEELEKRLDTLEFDSDEYNQVQAEMVAVEALLQDPKVLSWLRCLEIVAQLLKLTSHNLSDPIVDGMSRYILPAIDSDVPALREAGLENLGLFCLLDKRLAERYLIVFWRALNNPEEESEVKHTCVQSILDMAFSFANLQPHIFGSKQSEDDGEAEETGEGAKTSEAVEGDKSNDNDGEKGGNSDQDGDENMDKDKEAEPVAVPEKLDLDTIFIGLGQLITVDDLDLQSTIVEGFCRLFMMNRIDNITVLAILLETYFSPKLQKVQTLREHGFQSRSLQLLSIFFPAFVMATSANCMLLEEAATHLIQKSMEKLDIESSSMLDLGACSKYVMHLLSHNEQEEEAAVQAVNSRKKRAKKPERRRCAHHNRIGITICLEMLALEKVSAMESIHHDVVILRQKALLKMISWVEVTFDEQRSAALFKYLLQETTSSCFSSQKALLRSAEAALKRTSASYSEQCTEQSDEQQAAALEQDQTWAHDLVKERDEVLHEVLLKASADHEKLLKKQKREKQQKRRFISSDTSESSESESDEDSDDKPPAAPARRETSARRSKTAAVNRMHEKEGEFEAKIKQALQADDADESDEEEEEEESDSDEEDSESDANEEEEASEGEDGE
ncbi:Condensin complex subunit 3 [Phytophthora citrophthora]|uniref:Condensin complex subunit 3 n=1 Tax=Phytophthora citrophthora TaxID=4793 RepID=A0AAD9G8B1_9STRA|nr:Condensin complex subunit 3 [Phytophthora citrophthora]